MPYARSDGRVRAEQMYRENKGSIKLVEIAERLGVTPSKVRKWKSLDNWDNSDGSTKEPKKKQVERSTSSKGSVPQKNAPKKRGAPKGNKNAVGNNGGAPPRNKNAEKHGVYAEIFWDVLKDDEKQILNEIPEDEEQLLIDEIALLTIRERRLMEKINIIEQQVDATRGLMVDEVYRSETKRDFDSPEDRELYEDRQREKILRDELLPGHSYNLSTRTKDNSDLLLRAHAELTRVQEQRRRCTEALNRIRQSKGETKSNSVANEWIIALTGGGDDG